MSTVDPGTTPRFTPDTLPPRLPPAPHRPFTRWLAPAVAALTLVAGGTAAGFLWGRTGDGGTTPGGTASSAAPTGAVSTAPSGAASTGPSAAASTVPSTSQSTAPSASSPAAGPVRAVPVYYIADINNSPRLYREFHRVALIQGNPALTAVTEMLRDNAVDPDYASLWPRSTRVLSLTTSGDLATVDLSAFVATGASFEGAAVQQLVHTITAAQPAVHRVRLLVNGDTPPSGHFDWSAPVRRAAPFGMQSNVWILGPTEGETVSSPVTVSVYGTGYEGNVPLRVYRGEDVVASTFVTTMMGGFATARTTIDLAPGTYELRAYNDSGLDASLTLWDTKTFTVK